MANFRKRSGNWQARVSRKGHTDLTKTFASMEDARKWALSDVSVSETKVGT